MLDAFNMGMPLVVSAWADNVLRMVRALVRVARTEQVLGQRVGATGQGLSARVRCDAGKHAPGHCSGTWAHRGMELSRNPPPFNDDFKRPN